MIILTSYHKHIMNTIWFCFIKTVRNNITHPHSKCNINIQPSSEWRSAHCRSSILWDTIFLNQLSTSNIYDFNGLSFSIILRQWSTTHLNWRHFSFVSTSPLSPFIHHSWNQQFKLWMIPFFDILTKQKNQNIIPIRRVTIVFIVPFCVLFAMYSPKNQSRCAHRMY